MMATPPVDRLIGVSLNAAIDKIAVVDRLTPGTIHRPTMLSVVPGGKAINAVRAAVRLGCPGEVVAVVGGHAGAWLVGALDALGITCRPVRLAGESRTCLSVLDRSTGALTEFYEAGLRLDEASWPAVESSVGAALAQAPERAIVLLAGSLPSEAPTDAYRRLADVAVAAGARVVVDVSGSALEAVLAVEPWLVRVNAHEAAATTGLDTSSVDGVRAAGDALRRRGARHVLITRGTEGAVLIEDEGAWVVGPPPELGPYSVGSGDALTGGLVAAMAGGASLADALRRGGAAGAANALVPGQGELDPADVERLQRLTSVTRLDG
jgi:1-phosphofructokinase family hexose kinase